MTLLFKYVFFIIFYKDLNSHRAKQIGNISSFFQFFIGKFFGKVKNGQKNVQNRKPKIIYVKNAILQHN
jgi:hypothetical protein